MDLYNKIEELNALADRLTAKDDIINCFHRYVNFYSELHIEGMMKQFSTERKDICLEIGEDGLYEGEKAIREVFAFMPKLAKRPGSIIYHYVDTEVVEIAQDGLTAKLTCLAPGFDADAKALTQNWIYGKYYVDLIKEANGKWKLWHVQWFRNFEAPMMKGWLENSIAHDQEVSHPAFKDIYGDSKKSDKSNYPTNWSYPKHFVIDEVNYLLPEPPQPYKTWDGMTGTVKTRKE